MHFGRTAYEAYASVTGGKTFDGRDMPKWDDLPFRIRLAWEHAATTVAAQAVELSTVTKTA